MKNFLRKISVYAITKVDELTGKQHWGVYVAALVLVVLLALSLFAVQVAFVGLLITWVVNAVAGAGTITYVTGCLVAFVCMFLFGGSSR